MKYIFFIASILVLASCKKEEQYNPDLNISNAHWYKLNARSADTLFSVYIPNAFSPNGDGKNDSFKPQGNYLLKDIRVYSKTNQILFETNIKGEAWNGRINASKEIVPIGTYTYQLEVNDNYGEAYEYIGSVMLYR